MLTKSRFTLMTAAVLMAFVLSALWTVPVFADDSTPPPVDTPTEATPPVEEEVVEVVPAEPVAEPVVVDEAAPAEPVALTEVLEQLPEGTEVQVMDENGEALPLASQEAADAIAAADPIWCPSGVATPVSGGSGCSPSYTSFNDLLTWLTTNNPASAGTIWIEKTYNSSTATGTITDVGDTDFTLDGLSLTNMANFALTIQGGWNGIGTNTIDTNDPSEFRTALLRIVNWNANVTLSDVLVNGNNVAASNTGADNSALLVVTTGNIQLNRVTVKDSINAGAGATNGATLDNRTSTTASSVIVDNGVFENNEGDGLRVFSTGVVTITSIMADGNDKGGVRIDNSYAVTDLAVTLSGVQEYNNNGNGAGLLVISDGLVTISNVIANGNAGNGVDINNRTSLTSQGVTIAGTNMFNDNATGLKILSHGAITTNDIFALDNGDDGVVLDNCDDVGGCAVSGAPSVTMLGYNYFYNNGGVSGGDGLNVSTFGDIIAYNLTSSNNSGHGARLNNQWFNTAVPTASESGGKITLYGSSVFNNNGDDGLNATSNGDFTSYNLTANDNVNDGAEITVNKTQPYTYSYSTRVRVKKKYVYVTSYATIYEANITLNGVNNFNGNDNGDGLRASADGTITLYSITANNNGDEGAELTNTTDGLGIVLNEMNSFTNNNGAGLLITSAGAVTLNNITATLNTGNGVDVDNRTSLAGLAVTLNGSNMFNDNAMGLKVQSHGNITTNSISASGNNGDGVHLDNCDVVSGKCSVTGAPYVYLYGPNYFSNNTGGDGLDVSTFGQIIAYNLIATNNGQDGARLKNQWFNSASPTPVESSGSITLYGYNTFNNNGVDGLDVASSSDFTAYNTSANLNGDDGAVLSLNKTQPYTYSYSTRVKSGKKYIYVYTYVNVTAANVTLYGVNNFNGNGTGDGLAVTTDGAITIYNLTANGNGQAAGLGIGNGAILDNCSISTGSCSTNTEVNPVTIYGYVNVSDNNWRGLQIDSLGAVTLSNIIASGNLGVGARIDNQFNSSTSPAGVTISGSNIFNSNDSTGLVVLSYGAIALNNINAYNNGDSTPGGTSGAYLDNTVGATGIAPKNITLTGLNSFVGNYKWGLEFLSSGSVDIARISANGNDWDAANTQVGGGVSGTANTITLTCGHMFGNGGTTGDPAPGYNLAATGVLTLNGIYSSGNRAADTGTGSSVLKTIPCALP